MEDEKEEVDVRRHAMNQWTVIQPLNQRTSSTTAGSQSAAPTAPDELQARALWIEPLCRMLNGSVSELRYRAGGILIESLGSSDASPAFRAAWRNGVPSLAEAITARTSRSAVGR